MTTQSNIGGINRSGEGNVRSTSPRQVATLTLSLFVVAGFVVTPAAARFTDFHSALAAPRQAAARPEILKVEPPNWWAAHTINPVRLLVRGHNLAGASVAASDQRLKVSNLKVNESGSYLFVDVWIDPKAAPGAANIEVTNGAGRADIPFEISAPIAKAGEPQGFSTDDVLYLIMPDRFSDGDISNDDPTVSKGLYDRTKSRYYHGGDFQGIINHLDYLKNLGVTALWLTPVYDNVNHLNEHEQYDAGPITDYHGYGAVDFYGVEEHFGTVASLRSLIGAAHRIGIKVIQDQVANHTGPYHPWVADPPTPTWFNGTAPHHLANKWQTWTLADPHATVEMQRETLEGWFINILPDLNQNDPEVARYLIQNSLWWIGIAGFDAIREDTVPYVPRSFWSQWTSAIKRQYPATRILGEVFDADPAFTSFFQGGRKGFDGIDTGLDTVFDYPLYFAIRDCFDDGKNLTELATVLAHDRLYTDPDLLVTFLGLHDVPRFIEKEGAQGNPIKDDELELAQTFIMTTRGIPLLYYGDEIGMAGAGDPDNRRDFPGGFPGDPRDAFSRAGRSPIQQRIFDHLQRLCRLHHELPQLRHGRLINLLVQQQQYVYARATDRDCAVVAINTGNSSAELCVSVESVGLREGARLEDALGVVGPVQVKDGKIVFKLAARQSAVFAAR